MATTAHSTGGGNGDFAEYVSRDANAASPSRNGLGLALAIYAALIVMASLGGAFGTQAMEMGPRFAFWTALILWNAMKWHAWFSLVHRWLGWQTAVVAGSLALNLALPFETRIALGQPPALPAGDFLRIYSSAVAISLFSGLACTAAIRYFGTGRRRERAEREQKPAEALALREGGSILGVDQAELWAIEAEDHYVRLLLADCRAPLRNGRFGDALAQVGHINGCRIHRGRWVADAAVVAVEREGRAWRVVLPDGRRLPVSASHVGSIRERGWIGRTTAPPR